MKRANSVCVCVFGKHQQGDDIESHRCLEGSLCARLCILDQRVFGQMRRHHTLTLILLIHLTPPCLSEEVCVLMEVHYYCQGARLERHKVLGEYIYPQL